MVMILSLLFDSRISVHLTDFLVLKCVIFPITLQLTGITGFFITGVF